MNNIELYKSIFEMKQNTHRQKISKDFKADIDYDLRVLISNERKEAQKEERNEIKLLLESFDLNEAIEKIEIYEESIN